MKISRPVSNQISPIGLDIGFGEVRAVQLAQESKGVSLVCGAVFPRPSGPRSLEEFDGTEAAAVGAVLARRGFVGRRIAVAAPHAGCSAQAIDLPPKESGAPIHEIARAEVARKARVSPSGFELATWYLPSRGRTERGMAVACDRPVLDSYLNAFDQAGLLPVSVDLQECALARVVSGYLTEEPDAIHAMILVGWSTTLAVLTLGSTVVYTRRFDLGVGPGITRLKQRAGLSWPDAVRLLDNGSGASAISRFTDDGTIDPRGIRAAPSGGGMVAMPGIGQDEPACTDPDIFERAARVMWSELGVRLSEEADTAVTYVTHAHRSASVGRVMIAGYGAHRVEIVDTMDRKLGMPVECVDGWAGASALGRCTAARLAVAAGLAARFDR